MSVVERDWSVSVLVRFPESVFRFGDLSKVEARNLARRVRVLVNGARDGSLVALESQRGAMAFVNLRHVAAISVVREG